MIEKPMGEPEQWVVSPFSGGNGDCVEVGKLPGGVAVRDSKDPEGPRLRFTDSEWAAFQRGMTAGSFNDL